MASGPPASGSDRPIRQVFVRPARPDRRWQVKCDDVPAFFAACGKPKAVTSLAAANRIRLNRLI